jgi:hypothetical protein
VGYVLPWDSYWGSFWDNK